ncbi:Protein VMS1 [Erysiphe neolycopersici]|uniref:Protein VMS1 n=1 Tax=Erysiphe neolycopersici TaxID=212602 RepID=A0A420I5V5_9PEZI|nr:Protein VMS1 [Erysiphe neolycopersici]
MSNKKETDKRSYYVYNLPQDLLNTLTLKQSSLCDGQDVSHELEISNKNVPSQSDYSVGAQACSLCAVTFINVEEQRGHVRSDLHCYNVKQKIRGRNVVTEHEFEDLICDLSESISGSDISDIEEDWEENEPKTTTLSALMKRQATITSDFKKSGDQEWEKQHQVAGKSPLILFRSPILPENKYLSIYRALLTDTENKVDSSILEVLKKKQLTTKYEVKNMHPTSNQLFSHQALNQPHFFLCMIGGGHFAGMVVSLLPKQNSSTSTSTLIKDINILAHKTFHRYTTRRKQGGAQSANDSAKGAAHSAGASLRRYNERALIEEVRLLLQEWKSMIDSSELLFIRATGSTNRRTLFGPYSDQVLRQKDPRIRGFPFSTRRPTQKELTRSFFELTQTKLVEINEPEISTDLDAKSRVETRNLSAKLDRQSSLVSNKLTEEEETALLHTSQLQALIRRSRLPALLVYLKNNSLSPDFQFHPLDNPQNYQASTPLLLAAHMNSAPLITGLLLKGNADPGVRNQNGKTAYELAGDRASRQAFRIARFELGENRWDWKQAGIPSGISRDDAEEEMKKQKIEEETKRQLQRKLELEILKVEDSNPLKEKVPLGKAAMKGRMVTLGKVQKTAQEKREDEARGLTPEMRMKLDRERRARAAEERIKKMNQNN